jgi:hypothetical protein
MDKKVSVAFVDKSIQEAYFETEIENFLFEPANLYNTLK